MNGCRRRGVAGTGPGVQGSSPGTGARKPFPVDSGSATTASPRRSSTAWTRRGRRVPLCARARRSRGLRSKLDRAAVRPQAPARDGPERSLLLWGGSLDRSGTPLLEPSFSRQRAPGASERGRSVRAEWTDDRGRGAVRAQLRHAGGVGRGAPSLVFALPAPAEWAGRLATITLSGPGGSVSLDGRQGAAMSVLRDARTGRVTGMLRGQGADAAADAATRAGMSTAEVLLSAGVPEAEGWRR